MPRIPKYNLGKVVPRSTAFQKPRWMKTERWTANGWEQLDPDERIIVRKDWPMDRNYVTSNYAYPGSFYIEKENWEPVQGPELPSKLEERRQAIRAAQDAYDADLAEERARQAYNRKNIAQAVKMRKNELWRQYMEAEDPPPGIGWPEGKAERLDAEFEEQANWDVRGLRNPNEYPDPPDWDFREYYKDAPWRMW